MIRSLYSMLAPRLPWLAIGLLIPVLSFAQEPDRAPGDSGEPPAAEATDGDGQAQGGRESGQTAPRRGGPAEDFAPSEEISEDLSVPFPVDI